MYKYTLKSSLKKRIKTYYKGCPYVTYDWFNANIRPLLPEDGKSYFYRIAFKHAELFCFYSKKKLQSVYMNGLAFPVDIFDVEQT